MFLSPDMDSGGSAPLMKPPLTARDLAHYDASMALAIERFPLGLADAGDARLWTQLRMAFAAAIRSGWTDDEHRRRHTEIAASLEHERRSAHRIEAVTVDAYEAAVLQGLGL